VLACCGAIPTSSPAAVRDSFVGHGASVLCSDLEGGLHFVNAGQNHGKAGVSRKAVVVESVDQKGEVFLLYVKFRHMFVAELILHHRPLALKIRLMVTRAEEK
jgi:hypothetical protein